MGIASHVHRGVLERKGPIDADSPVLNPELAAHICPACGDPFKVGDYVTIVSYGPGKSPEERKKAWSGRPYNAVGAVTHWACATGDES